MNDIKQALAAAIERAKGEWSEAPAKPADAKRELFRVTNNVTHRTFDAIRDNPGMTGEQAMRMLEGEGFKRTSVSSLITQFVRSGTMHRDSEGKLHVTSSKYKPPKRFKKPAKVKGTAFPLTPQTTRTTSLVQVVGPIQRTADDILNTLTLREARAVFDELKKVFGGV